MADYMFWNIGLYQCRIDRFLVIPIFPIILIFLIILISPDYSDSSGYSESSILRIIPIFGLFR